MTVILALLLTVLPHEPWPVDYVGAVEFNAVHNRDGSLRRSQAIWFDLAGPTEVRDWRWFKPDHLPVCGWMLFWDDQGCRTMRAVQLADPNPFRSRTYYDPEVEHRKVQPIEWRRRLVIWQR